MNFQDLLTREFAWGFYLGLIFLLIAAYNYLRLKGEFSRYRRHLSDKLEIEADAAKKTRGELEMLRKENESLRVKINALNEMPDRKAQRDLEIYARAEKRMLVGVPGFAPAWESAKNDSHQEMIEEEAGRSAPKRIFARLFGGGSAPAAALPARDSGNNVHDSEPAKTGTEH